MMIQLLDGSSLDSDFLRFDAEHYHFYLGNDDVTDLIRRADKLAWAERWDVEFDVEFENERIYVEKYYRENGKLPPNVGSDSVWWNFTKLIVTDPLRAPIEEGAKWLTGTYTGWVMLGLGAWWLWTAYDSRRSH